MINVTRLAQPPSLRRNAARWKRELLEQIKRCAKERKSVPAKYFDRYKQKDVRDALARMYGKRCCYCETSVGIVDYPHIEHRKPKSVKKGFPQLTFAWTNLHLACTKCNTAKGDSYNRTIPILDAVKDVPISSHLTYTFDAQGVWRSPISHRGRTTVEHTDLNRPELRDARTQVLLPALDVITKLNCNPEHPNAMVTTRRLQAWSREEYGSLIAFAMESLYRPDDGMSP
jgi:5-methylcytosine-specific restriction endonuclease McrA